MEKSVMIGNIDQVARQRNFFMVLLLVMSVATALLSLKLASSHQKLVLVPGLNQEVWVDDGGGVSASYLEETASMYLPLLLDLTADSIEWKKERLLSHVSQSDEQYMRLLNEYFARAKEKYKQFGLSTHFAVKSFEIDSKKMKLKAHGQLTSRFGQRGYESVPAIYGLGFEWVTGKLMLTEFVKLSKDGLSDSEMSAKMEDGK